MCHRLNFHYRSLACKKVQKKNKPGLSRPCLAIGQDCTVDAPQGLSKFRTPPKRKRCVKIHQLSKRWVLHLYESMYIQVSLVHCRFPSFPSLKGFTFFVQCLTEDGKADLHKDISLCLGSNATGLTSWIASYFVIMEMLFQGNFFWGLGISPVARGTPLLESLYTEH